MPSFTKQSPLRKLSGLLPPPPPVVAVFVGVAVLVPSVPVPDGRGRRGRVGAAAAGWSVVVVAGQLVRGEDAAAAQREQHDTGDDQGDLGAAAAAGRGGLAVAAGLAVAGLAVRGLAVAALTVGVLWP